MKIFEKHSFPVIVFRLFIFGIFTAAAFAQSTEQTYPTPITTNQLNGTIKARDIGDNRRTSYFYTFDGAQGDVFLNVVTSNLNGDIDVFAADGLRPLTKIVMYADTETSETGRVFYLRKPEKIILRVEGRSPNDEPATFQIKFAGSFVAAADTGDAPSAPEVKSENRSDVIVNSVGTIIGVKPKPTPEPKEIPAEESKETVAEKRKKPKTKKENVSEKETASQTEPEKQDEIRVETPEETAPEKINEIVVADKSEQPKETTQTEQPESNNTNAAAENKAKNLNIEQPTEREKLAAINLTIILKNGDKFTRPMSEVFSLNTSNGRVTVITDDGKIRNFSIFDIAQMKIE